MYTIARVKLIPKLKVYVSLPDIAAMLPQGGGSLKVVAAAAVANTWQPAWMLDCSLPSQHRAPL